MIEPVLSVDGVGIDFGDRSVLNAASLHIHAGQIEGLVGRNGAGKSTLFGIAAGLIAPKHGIIVWKGQRFTRVTLPRLAREGLMFLPADRLLAPWSSVREQLTMFAQAFPGGMSVDDAIHAMRLTECAERRPHDLSGGECRRADLAAALVRKPVCLIADEVFRDVAPLDCDFIGETLRGIAATGTAIAISGHELAFVMQFTDHITWCTGRTTRLMGSPAQANAHDNFRADFLGQRW